MNAGHFPFPAGLPLAPGTNSALRVASRLPTTAGPVAGHGCKSAEPRSPAFSDMWVLLPPALLETPLNSEETLVNNIVYIVGAVVIIIALLSFFGLR